MARIIYSKHGGPLSSNLIAAPTLLRNAWNELGTRKRLCAGSYADHSHLYSKYAHYHFTLAHIFHLAMTMQSQLVITGPYLLSDFSNVENVHMLEFSHLHNTICFNRAATY